MVDSGSLYVPGSNPTDFYTYVAHTLYVLIAFHFLSENVFTVVLAEFLEQSYGKVS